MKRNLFLNKSKCQPGLSKVCELPLVVLQFIHSDRGTSTRTLVEILKTRNFFVAPLIVEQHKWKQIC
jgi:hypothetical protein